MEKGKISIIMPAYNAAAFIEKCVSSILKQTYKNFEIIIVNDGSKDNTLEIINSLAKNDERVKPYSQENGGVSAARNTALSKITGEFVTCVDADDSLPETALEDMLSCMEDGVDFVIGSHTEIRILREEHIEEEKVFTKEETFSKFKEFDSVNWWPWGKLFKAEIIKKHNMKYDTNMTFGEDHIFNLLYARYITGKAFVTSKNVYNYHSIRGGLCSKYYPQMNEFQKYTLLRMADFFGGIESFPYEYKSFYAGSYLKGLVEYYCAWLSRENAAERIENSFNLFSDILDENILKEYFTNEQCSLINKNQYFEFTKDFIKKNPRQTLWRKFRRSVRRFLELLQRIFLKRL